MEKASLNAIEERVNKHLQSEYEYDAIAYVEDELDDIIDRIFAESNIDKDQIMVGNATILHAVKGGYLICTDEGKVFMMPNNSYKGTNIESGTRIMCGKFRMSKGRLVCVDAQECLSMNELKYQMFCFIDAWDMAKASSAAWAIYKDASPQNQEAMKYCIHKLREYQKSIIKIGSKKIKLSTICQ